MSAFHNGHSLASSAVLKLVQQYDKNINSAADLKNGVTLLNLFLELNVLPQKTYQSGRNPFQFIKKCIKKSSDKDFFQHVNLDLCEKGNEAELLSLSSCLLYALHSQQKENVVSPSDVLSNQEANVLWSIWMELDPCSFSADSSNRSSSKLNTLKEYNCLPKHGSPHKQRSIDTPSALKKEIRKKEMCITNLRTLLDEEQERISELLLSKKTQEEQISKFEKVMKEQQEKLALLNETAKLSYDIEDFQQHIKTLTQEKERLELRVKELKSSKRELVFFEAENADLRNVKDNLDMKVSSLEDFNRRLSTQVLDLERRHCESALLQQRLDILNEELKVKEETIFELNNMIAIYQDRLDGQKAGDSLTNLDTSDGGEIVGVVCSPFRDTSNELTALQNEVNCLQYDNDKLQSSLKEATSSLEKSSNENCKLNKEVDTLQKLVDHLNWQVQENQSSILSLDAQIETKDCTISELTKEKNRLLIQVKNLTSEIEQTKQQIMKLHYDQEESLKILQQRDEEIQVYKNEVIQVQNDICQLTRERQVLLEQVKNLEEDGYTLKSEIVSGGIKIEKLGSQVQELEDHIAQLKSINCEYNEMLNSLKEDKSNCERALFALQEKYANLITLHDNSNMEKDKISLELNNIHEDYLTMKNKGERLQSQLNAFQESNNSLEKELSVVCAEKEKLLKIIEDVKAKNASLSENLNSMEGKLTTAENCNLELQVKSEQLIIARDKLQVNIVDLESQLKEATAKYEEALETVEYLTSDLKLARNELEVLKEEHVQLKCSFCTLEDENSKLQKKYDESCSQNQTYSSEIETIQQHCNNANSTISVLNGTVQESFNKISELSEVIKLSKKQYDMLSIENEKLASQKSVQMEKCAQLEKEVKSLHELKSILSNQIEELLSEKLALQAKLQASNNKVDANTSAGNLSFTEIVSDNDSCVEDKDAVIKDLERDLRDTKEIHKTQLSKVTEDCAELLIKVESLLLDLRSKEKYIEYLESEKQQALEKLIKSVTEFQQITEGNKKELTALHNKNKSLETEIQSANLQNEKSGLQLLECKEEIERIRIALEVVLTEKAEVIGALCEKEESLKHLQEALNEHRVLNSEQSALIDDNSKIISGMEEKLKLKTLEAEELLCKLRSKETEFEELSHLNTELDCAKNRLEVSEVCHAAQIKDLEKELESCVQQNKVLIDNVSDQTSIINELTDKLLSSSEANDVLVAETIQEAKEIVFLKESLKSSAGDIEHLKSVIDSNKKEIATLQNIIHNLNGQLDIVKNKENEHKHENVALKAQVINSNCELEKLLAALNEKSMKVDFLATRNEELIKENESLVLQTVNSTNKIQDLNTMLSSLVQKDQDSCIKNKENEDPNKMKTTTMQFIQNPALKEWLNQFESLSQKIQRMKSKHMDEQDSKHTSEFENSTLTMIRDHIHSWFTSSDFLLQDSKCEVSQLLKHSIHVNSGEETSEQSMVTDPSQVSHQDKSPLIQAELQDTAELCKHCEHESDKTKLIEQELQQRRQELDELEQKILSLSKKLGQKEKEAALYKEALSMYKQKVEDLKQQQNILKVKHGEDLIRNNEQSNNLQGKLEAAQARLMEMDKKYLDEMKTVHKKYQEKINLLNVTSKDLSQSKMELVNTRKQYSDLMEKYALIDSKLKNANASLKKQRLENENLKIEMRNKERVKEQLTKEDYYARRMTMLPSTSFMQHSFCSSNDVSLDSMFAKPVVPANRFTCDEEEGQFLDQSRNVSDLQEGRVNMSHISSNKTRLEELKRRNTFCRPQMRSHYPIETQNMADESIEGMIRTPLNAKKNPASSASVVPPSSSTASSHSMSSVSTSSTVSNEKKVADGHRKRKEFWQIPVDMSTPAKKTNKVPNPSSHDTKAQNRKPPFFKVFSPFRKEKPKNPLV